MINDDMDGLWDNLYITQIIIFQTLLTKLFSLSLALEALQYCSLHQTTKQGQRHGFGHGYRYGHTGYNIYEKK